MKPDFYTFIYNTKTCKCKRITYATCSWRSALKRFKKNVRCTKLLDMQKSLADIQLGFFEEQENLMGVVAKTRRL